VSASRSLLRLKNNSVLGKKYAMGGGYCYPQTEAGTDNTPIEWIVPDVQGDKALPISRYGLDARAYHKDFVSITWERCTLRTWLNSTFLNEAFSANEQNAILTTTADESIDQLRRTEQALLRKPDHYSAQGRNFDVLPNPPTTAVLPSGIKENAGCKIKMHPACLTYIIPRLCGQ